MSNRYDDRDEQNFGRRSESDYGRSSNYGGRTEYRFGGGRERESERYGREGYWGGGWENERDERSRYGNPMGGSGFERGYNQSSSGGYSQGRYNYPGGYRSGSERYGESYGERGYGYDRERSGRGDERGWWDRASDEVASWFGDEDAERRRRMDEQRAHRRGRGPKGYRRSDERIKEDVNDRLGDDYYIDASDIEVMVENQEVTLTGTVTSRTDKRRAEDIAESVSGVTNVENRLRVKQSGYGDYTSTGTGSSLGSTTGTSSSAGTGLESRTQGTTTSSAAAGGGGTRGGRTTGD